MKIERDKDLSELYSNEMQQISLKHAELTRTTRIRLERDNEELQVELELLKANVLLNADKIDYNFQILKKREEENVLVRDQQKRRLARLNGTIDELKNKIKDLKKQSNLETFKLTEDILKWRRKIIELEEKSTAMTEHNDFKYNSIWKMNYDICVKLLDKVLLIDKILHEQQLGLQWDDSLPPLLKKENLRSYKKTVNIVKEESDTNASKCSSNMPNEINLIINGIVNRGKFLVEKKVRDLLKPYTETQKQLVKINNIFDALNINRFDDITNLNNHFMNYAFCMQCRKSYKEICEMALDMEFHKQKLTEESNIEDIEQTEIELSDTEDTACKVHEYALATPSILEALKTYLQSHVLNNKSRYVV